MKAESFLKLLDMLFQKIKIHQIQLTPAEQLFQGEQVRSRVGRDCLTP